MLWCAADGDRVLFIPGGGEHDARGRGLSEFGIEA